MREMTLTEFAFFNKISRRNPIRAIGVCIIISHLALMGCSEHEADVTTQLAEIQALPPLPIEPLPEPKFVEVYRYDASQLRNPFMPIRNQNVDRSQRQNPIHQGQSATPDFNRVKGVMEQYELDKLSFSGSMVSPNGKRYGLVKRPDGLVVSVQVGDYIGTNHGRIFKIDANEMTLIEIIPNGSSGYIENRAFLTASL